MKVSGSLTQSESQSEVCPNGHELRFNLAAYRRSDTGGLNYFCRSCLNTDQARRRRAKARQRAEIRRSVRWGKRNT